MRILVIGGSGQVARALGERADTRHVVQALGRQHLDIADRTTIDRAISNFKPDVLVNAAAYTAVDRAESEETEAFAINRDGAENAAASADAGDIPIIHLSTDYVFSGEKLTPYSESDPTGPRSAYGRSKRDGEIAVANANPAHVILRTAWVYSPWGSNFLRTMLRLAVDRDSVRVVADQCGTPTYAPDIAEAILLVARHVHSDRTGHIWRGVFNMTAQGGTTWAGFAEAIFAASAARGGPSARVEPITTSEYPTAAPRPANSRLTTDRFRSVFGQSLPRWEDGVERCLDALLLPVAPSTAT